MEGAEKSIYRFILLKSSQAWKGSSLVMVSKGSLWKSDDAPSLNSNLTLFEDASLSLKYHPGSLERLQTTMFLMLLAINSCSQRSITHRFQNTILKRCMLVHQFFKRFSNEENVVTLAVVELVTGNLADLKFVGKIRSLQGIWFGVELHKPDTNICNSLGTHVGQKLFSCEADCGVLMTVNQIKNIYEKGLLARSSITNQGDVFPTINPLNSSLFPDPGHMKASSHLAEIFPFSDGMSIYSSDIDPDIYHSHNEFYQMKHNVTDDIYRNIKPSNVPNVELLNYLSQPSVRYNTSSYNFPLSRPNIKYTPQQHSNPLPPFQESTMHHGHTAGHLRQLYSNHKTNQSYSPLQLIKSKEHLNQQQNRIPFQQKDKILDKNTDLQQSNLEAQIQKEVIEEKNIKNYEYQKHTDVPLNSLVQVFIPGMKRLQNGVLKWKGIIHKQFFYGVELEVECSAATNGSFCGEGLFSCPPHRGYFTTGVVLREDDQKEDDNKNEIINYEKDDENKDNDVDRDYDNFQDYVENIKTVANNNNNYEGIVRKVKRRNKLKKLQSLTRTSRNSKEMFNCLNAESGKDLDSLLKSMNVKQSQKHFPIHIYNAPSFETGCCLGIQGFTNSCYLDTVLFSMFAFNHSFDSLLQRTVNNNHIEDYNHILNILNEDIVNPLRRDMFVTWSQVYKLRKCIQKNSLHQGYTLEAKDPEELILCLFKDILKVHPFNIFSSGLTEYLFQLINDTSVPSTTPSTFHLLSYSIQSFDIKFSNMPDNLILLIPRYGKEKVFNKIFPSPQIEIRDFISVKNDEFENSVNDDDDNDDKNDKEVRDSFFSPNEYKNIKMDDKNTKQSLKNKFLNKIKKIKNLFNISSSHPSPPPQQSFSSQSSPNELRLPFTLQPAPQSSFELIKKKSKKKSLYLNNKKAHSFETKDAPKRNSMPKKPDYKITHRQSKNSDKGSWGRLCPSESSNCHSTGYISNLSLSFKFSTSDDSLSGNNSNDEGSLLSTVKEHTTSIFSGKCSNSKSIYNNTERTSTNEDDEEEKFTKHPSSNKINNNKKNRTNNNNNDDNKSFCMELHSVMCIERSHYVSFVKCGDSEEAPWLLFDSMADREEYDEGFNIPKVKHCEGIAGFLSQKSKAMELMNSDFENLSEDLRRLLRDPYICFYRKKYTF